MLLGTVQTERQGQDVGVHWDWVELRWNTRCIIVVAVVGGSVFGRTCGTHGPTTAIIIAIIAIIAITS
jgi:predicted anti-sigma-YlaC factor YlaD